jgi:hypothetical protein
MSKIRALAKAYPAGRRGVIPKPQTCHNLMRDASSKAHLEHGFMYDPYQPAYHIGGLLGHWNYGLMATYMC